MTNTQKTGGPIGFIKRVYSYLKWIQELRRLRKSSVSGKKVYNL